MKRFKIQTTCLLFLVLITEAAFSVGVPHLEIPKLVDSSDVVLIASVSIPRRLAGDVRVDIGDRTFPATKYSVEARTIAVIKGEAPSTLSVQYLLPKEFEGYDPIQPGIRILFLSKPDSTFVPADPYHPDLPAVGAIITTGGVNTDRIAQIAEVFNQLAAVIASPTASNNEKIEAIVHSYALPKTEQFNQALGTGIANARDAFMRQRLQAELLCRDDISQLSSAAELLLSQTADRDGRVGFLYAIGNRITDPRAVPILLKLLSSEQADVRTAAAEALWHIADKSTASTLVKLLDDTNADVRYYAVRGLADITGQNLWGPSIPEFQENGQKYIQHWREWAKGRRLQ